jgi:hypothetical protein
MAELADAADSKSADLRVLGVRLPLPAPSPTHSLATSSVGTTGQQSSNADRSLEFPTFPCSSFLGLNPSSSERSRIKKAKPRNFSGARLLEPRIYRETNFLRITPAMLSRPVPNITSEPGSGTVDIVALETVPDCKLNENPSSS